MSSILLIDIWLSWSNIYPCSSILVMWQLSSNWGFYCCFLCSTTTFLNSKIGDKWQMKVLILRSGGKNYFLRSNTSAGTRKGGSWDSIQIWSRIHKNTLHSNNSCPNAKWGAMIKIISCKHIWYVRERAAGYSSIKNRVS